MLCAGSVRHAVHTAVHIANMAKSDALMFRCQIWNFRSKTVSRSCASVHLIPPPGDAATSSGVRKRKAPTGGTAAQDNALEAGEEEDSIFTDAAKRTKILGGVSGVSSFGVSGFGGWGGGMQASLVGPKWAQLPLGALTSPAPTPALSASRTKLAFHPVSEVVAPCTVAVHVWELGVL
jgi:hypothetical protein